MTDISVQGISATSMNITTSNEPAGVLERVLYHGSLHMLLGGVWDCPIALDAHALGKAPNKRHP